jgi:CheY-like chemotaxis protein
MVIEIDKDLAPQLPAILGDESEIRDALTNLILNAVDAMPEGGRLTLRTRAAADRVVVEVTDTGVGMDEATRSRCLELYFTTKGARGTGLGLAMVYGTVDRHGGELQIDSQPGAGTTMRLIFAAALSPSRAGGETRAEVHAQRPLRILVIDDDPIVLQSLRTSLEMDGHAVEATDGGRRGIDAFSAAIARDEPFAAVITDLGMPHVDGRAVAAAVKSIRPDIPVILLTGWGHRLLTENDVPRAVDRVLGKPPTVATLRAVLSDLTHPPTP